MSSRGEGQWPAGALPEIAPEVLTDILAKATDIAITVGPDGVVQSVLINPTNRSFGQLNHWQGRDLRDYLTSESIPKFDRKLAAALEAEDATALTGALELNHTDGAAWEFPIRYTLHPLGEGATLMIGRDLRPIAEVQLQLAKAQMALERDHEAQRDFDTRYRVLLNVTRDPIVFINMSGGRITDLNKSAAQLLGATRDSLIGVGFAQEFDSRRGGEVMESLSNAAEGEPVELRSRRTRRTMRVSPTLFRAAGDRLLVCRLEPLAAEGSSGDELTDNLTQFYQNGPDAIVFSNGEGSIQSANDSFLALVEAADLSTVKGRSLADFLTRGGIDLKILTENAARAGQMRMYSTKLAGEFGAQIAVEISAAHLADQATPAFVFVIRDVGRTETARGQVGPMTEDAARNVVDLVGATNLKNIVAETTEVVEKMCIETAVELTRNNRVAAAEMLGLSRQSLYVKLRKYGLLER